MLNLITEENGDEVIVFVDGMMDTKTSPQMSEELSKYTCSAKKLILDLEKLTYVSSAGLRVFVMADQQAIQSGGELSVRNIPKSIMEVFEMTGFDNMLNIV